MRKMALTATALLAFAAAACASSAGAQSSGAQKPLAHSVRVSEGDMYLRASATKLAAGRITFRVTNKGGMDHEFVIVSGNPAGTKGDEPGRVSEARHIGGEEGPEIGNVAPGQTKSLTASLSPGRYTAMCNLPGHFDGGMHFQFVVQ